MRAKREAPTVLVPWCNLDSLCLVPGDVRKAITFFEQRAKEDTNFRRRFGAHVGKIIVNPKNEALARAEVDGDIIIELCAGTLVWEVWLGGSSGNNFITREVPPQAPSLEQSEGDALIKAQSVQKSSTACFSKIINGKSHVQRPRGRPPKKVMVAAKGTHRRGRPEKVPAAQAREMREKGANPEQISQALGVSLATVYRHLGQNQKRRKCRG